MKKRFAFVSNSSSTSFIVEPVTPIGEVSMRTLNFMKKMEDPTKILKDALSNWEMTLDWITEEIKLFEKKQNGEKYSTLLTFALQLRKSSPVGTVGLEEESKRVEELYWMIKSMEFNNKESVQNIKIKANDLKNTIRSKRKENPETKTRYECTVDISWGDERGLVKFLGESGHIKILSEKTT